MAQPSKPTKPGLPASIWKYIPFTITSTCYNAGGGTGALKDWYRIRAETRAASGGLWEPIGSWSDWKPEGTPAEIEATYYTYSSQGYPPGLYEIRVQAWNSLGDMSDWSTAASLDLLLDTTAPEAPQVTGPSHVPVGTDAVFTSYATYENTGSGVQLAFEYGPVGGPYYGPWTVETEFLSPGTEVLYTVVGSHLAIAGEYEIRAIARDRTSIWMGWGSGNESPGQWFRFFVGDQPSPPIPSSAVYVQPHTATHLKMFYQRASRKYALDGSEDGVQLDAPQPYVKAFADQILVEMGITVQGQTEPEQKKEQE